MTRKTLEEHLEFAGDCARLAFFFAYDLAAKRPEETLESVLRLRSPLYHVALGLDPEVPQDIFTVFPDAGSASDFEEKMWRQCRDFILSRAEKHYPDSLGMGLHGVWQAECFKFDPPKPDFPGRCSFHIGNARAPESLFADWKYVADHLLLMLDLMEKEYGATEAATASWLNSKPMWLRFFPNEWQDRMTDRPTVPLWHLGYWGQIVSARGTCNRNACRYIREYRRLRYAMRSSWCPIPVLRQHLAGLREEAFSDGRGR